MIKFQRIPDMVLPVPTSLPQVQVTPEGQALGSIPGWSLYFDPDYSSVSGNWVRNRALPATVSRPRGGDLALDEFPNTESAIYATDGAAYNTTVKTVISATACSGFVVLQMAAAAEPAQQRLIRSDGTPSGYGLHFAVSDTGNQFSLRNSNIQGDAFPVIYATPAENLFVRSGPSLIMFTFSTLHGMALYENGELLKSEPSETAPFESGIGETDVVIMQNCRGRYGVFGLLNIDLSAPENAAHRRSIEQFMIAKYGISA